MGEFLSSPLPPGNNGFCLFSFRRGGGVAGTMDSVILSDLKKKTDTLFKASNIS